MDAEKTGKLIKELRSEKGLTQQELASLLKVSPTAVSKWENGKNLPDISVMEAMAEILNVSCSEIILGERAPQPALEGNADEVSALAESAVKSVIDESVAQRKRRTRRAVILAAIILALLAAILPYYLREVPVRNLSAGDYVSVKAYHTIDFLWSDRLASELVDISFNINDVKQHLSKFALSADRVWSVRVEKIWLVMSSPDSGLKFRSEDEILKDETAFHYGPYQGTIDRIEKAEDGQYDFHVITGTEYGGVPDEEIETEILADVWILVTYRKDFPWSRRYSVMLRASGTDTLLIKPEP